MVESESSNCRFGCYHCACCYLELFCGCSKRRRNYCSNYMCRPFALLDLIMRRLCVVFGWFYLYGLEGVFIFAMNMCKRTKEKAEATVDSVLVFISASILTLFKTFGWLCKACCCCCRCFLYWTTALEFLQSNNSLLAVSLYNDYCCLTSVTIIIISFLLIVLSWTLASIWIVE